MVHGVGRHQRVDDAICSGIAPADFAHPPQARGDGECEDRQRRKSECAADTGLTQPTFRMEPVRQKQKRAENTQGNVRVQQVPKTMRRSDFDQHDAEKAPGGQENPAEASKIACAPKKRNEKSKKEQKDEDSGGDVEQIDNRVADGGRGEAVQIGSSESEEN